MTQQLPAPGDAEAARPYAWDGTAWVPAPAGWHPPPGWLPTGTGWTPAPDGWTPPPGWVRTPSGYLPPPPGHPAYGGHPSTRYRQPQPWPQPAGPDAGTRGFGWTRCLPGRLQRAAALGDRKPSGWEIVVMLAVFPAASVVAALISLGQTLANYSDGSAHVPTIVPGHVVVSTVLFTALALTDFAPALLAVYLLSLSGGGLRAIGLDLSRPRADVARSGKVVLYAFAGPILVVGGLLGNLTPHANLAGSDSTHLPVAYLIPLVLSSIGAGVVEEIVVLGFLCHRLEQRGWDGWQLYAVLIAVRVSYHLYYGVAALGFAVWGGLMVMLYRRRRRLLTFVVAHVVWDTSAFVTQYLHHGYAALPFLVEILLLVGLWMYGREPAVAEIADSAQAVRAGESVRPVPV